MSPFSRADLLRSLGSGRIQGRLWRGGLGSIRNRLLVTALQVKPSARKSSIDSCFSRAVKWRLVLVELVNDGKSEDHSVSPIDLSMKSE